MPTQLIFCHVRLLIKSIHLYIYTIFIHIRIELQYDVQGFIHKIRKAA